MKKDVITLPTSGPQHPCITHEMYETYKELYDVVKNNFNIETLSRFFPMQGDNYNEFKQLSRLEPFDGEDFPTNEQDAEKYFEPAVRLMIIGRSVNGWTQLTETSADDFATNAANAIVDKGFSWLRDDGRGVDTYTRESDGKECRYNINGSSFFRCTRKILNKMKPITTMCDRWFEHIVWSNLYTVAPLHNGNAEGKLQDVQLELSKKLLLQQIEFYKPTHILFITDWDWWFDRFTDVFPDVKKTGNSTTDNVVGKGVFNKAKIVVSVRPDRTWPNRPNEEQFVNDVVNAF